MNKSILYQLRAMANVIAFLFVTPIYGATAKVSFSAPINNSTVQSPVKVSIYAQGTPRQFTLYVDGKSTKQVSYSGNLSTSLSLSAGSHSLKATASYSSRSSSSATVQVTVGQSSSGGGSTTPPAGSASAAEQIADDMAGSNEGNPHGVPVGWFGPSLVSGNTLQGNAIEAWGGLYIGPNGNPATNTLVNLRNFSAYVLSKSTGKWTAYPFAAADVDGGFYSETFSVDYGTSIPFRHESDGSLSFSTTSGKVAHFYAPWPRIDSKASDFGGIVVTCEARLVLNNASGTDDRSIASFVMDVGADPYPTTTGAGIENNPGIGMGKFKYVQTAWRSFSFTSLSEADLEANPPPVSFSGVNP